jgi:CRISPR-associated endoribonuclease Cas6
MTNQSTNQTTLDLLALVVQLTPVEPVTLPAHLGRAVYQWWLSYMAEDDPALAESLHNSDERKPFTCSTLIGGRRGDAPFTSVYQPEQPVWFRLTGLTPAVGRQLQRLAETAPSTIELHHTPFTVQAVATADHEWAGQSGYEQLAEPFLLAKAAPQFRVALRFASPTTFRSQAMSQPVPLPAWVFGSLLDRWNSFSPIQLADETRRYAAECIALSHYALRTRAVPLKEKIVQMGCLGLARYHLLNRDKFWANMINLLAAYSFYSGVGYQTTIGLGQTRPVD